MENKPYWSVGYKDEITNKPVLMAKFISCGDASIMATHYAKYSTRTYFVFDKNMIAIEFALGKLGGLAA